MVWGGEIAFSHHCMSDAVYIIGLKECDADHEHVEYPIQIQVLLLCHTDMQIGNVLGG